MSQEPAAVPAAWRLRRLRWQMTLWFTLANLVGLLILAGVALRVNNASSRHNEYAEALRRVNTAAALISVDSGQINLRSLRHDPVAVGHPELYVLAGNGGPVVFAGWGGRYSLGSEQLRALAVRAEQVPDPVRMDTRDARGNPVYLIGQRFYDGEELAGVIVAVGDPGAGGMEQRRLLWALIAGTATLVLASSAVGYSLAGRAVRPAVASLSQQERFLADASHELRTPIAALRAAAEAALAEAAVPGTPDGTVSRLRLEGIVRDVGRLGLLADALLTRARLKAGVQAAQREPLRLDLLVEDIIADLTEGGLPGDIVYSPTSVVVEGDPTLLRLAVRNLIENAIRHGHHPGARAEVRVSVGPRVVVVADDGPGVAQDIVERGFTRYKTGSQSGTGLGLSIVSEVASAHGGRLEVRNATDHGAVFTLVLGT